ncbi:sensor histidine kinase [Erythrobacter sp. SD-21]|uniref:sensor histidine kinase n=1 Tax=Erythrobacter sp. SD-21 TaxID=161528 RepID=UPI000153F378|nr:PAS domain-containing protein [Erythrobacter sp. SD-21]EDL49556.1 hypothetical protein ED21_18197 [Erythrobacter sp. SD-21]
MYQKNSIPWPEGKAPDAALCSEDNRLSVLAAYGAASLSEDPELTQVAEFTAKLFGAPMAMVSIVEKDRQAFLARTGIEADGTPRNVSFCAHAMLGAEPMVIPDATQDPRFAENALVTGSPHVRFYAGYPLVSTEGAPLGALCVIDTEPREGLTELERDGLAVLAKSVMRRLSQARLGESATRAVEERERDLRRMIDSVPGIAWRGDEQGNFTYINARWAEVTGLQAPQKTADWEAAIHPEDWEGAVAKFGRALDEGTYFEDEWRIRRADGSYRWVQSRAVPTKVGDQATHWFGTVVDIDKTHRLSESRDLLARELSHRIKNIFAVVSGLIAIRARGREEVADFAMELSETIRALGAAHDYVRPHEGKRGETLSGLLDDLLAPYDKQGGGRFEISGPGVPIGERAATPLALIFHELATNAAKYGALSCAEGKVVVSVEDECEGEGTVCITWEERAVACGVDSNSEREGFGSRLLRLAVESQLGGSFERSFSDDGLDVRIVFPRKNIVG